MAIKTIEELTSMTTSELTSADTLLVSTPGDTSDPVKKISAEAAFSGGGGGGDVVVYNATAAIVSNALELALGTTENPVTPTDIIGNFTEGKSMIINAIIDLTSMSLGTQYWQITVGMLTLNEGTYYLTCMTKGGNASPVPVTFEASSSDANMVATISFGD